MAKWPERYNMNNNYYEESLLGENVFMKKTNLNYIKWAKLSYGVGKYDLLHVKSPSSVDIDYLALYSKPGEYCKTSKTAVAFFEDDIKFDGPKGLWASIYYGYENNLEKIKDRLKNVRYIISPDCSQCGDLIESFNIHNIQKIRVTSIFLTNGCDKLVIPTITYANERSFEYFLDGLEECQVVCFSTKGVMKSREGKRLLAKALKITINKLKNLKQIIIYSVCVDDSEVLKIFEPAAVKGIKISIPDNLLKRRNRILGGFEDGKI